MNFKRERLRRAFDRDRVRTDLVWAGWQVGAVEHDELVDLLLYRHRDRGPLEVRPIRVMPVRYMYLAYSERFSAIDSLIPVFIDLKDDDSHTLYAMKYSELEHVARVRDWRYRTRRHSVYGLPQKFDPQLRAMCEPYKMTPEGWLRFFISEAPPEPPPARQRRPRPVSPEQRRLL